MNAQFSFKNSLFAIISCGCNGHTYCSLSELGVLGAHPSQGALKVEVLSVESKPFVLQGESGS